MRVVQQVQIGQNVLDLLALVELQAVDDLVRDALQPQGVFDRPREGVDAVEDGKVARPATAGADFFGDPLGDPVRFVLACRADHQTYGRARGIVGKQLLRFPPDVVRDQVIGDPEDIGRAAEVLLQPHDFDLREILLELQDVAQVRAPPAVDRLVGVARHRQIRMVDRQRPHDGVLGQVGVLVFVDQDVAVPLVELGPQFVLLAQQRGHVQQQVVEIAGVGGDQPLLVLRIDAGHDGPHHAVRPRHVLVCRDQAVLGPADRAGNGFRRRVRDGGLTFAEHSLEHSPAVIRIVDGVVLVQADQRRVLPQQAGAERMKGPHPHAAVLGEPLDPLPHLVRGLVGERQRQDLAGRDAVQQQVRDAVRDDPRLAAAGPGQNQQRPIDMRGRFTLRRRQRSQQVRRVGNGERAFHRGQGTTRKRRIQGHPGLGHRPAGHRRS